DRQLDDQSLLRRVLEGFGGAAVALQGGEEQHPRQHDDAEMSVDAVGEPGAAHERDRGEREGDQHGPAGDGRGGAGGHAEHRERPHAGRAGQQAKVAPGHTVASARIFSRVAGPMPETSRRPSTEVKAPFFSRCSRMRWAMAGPTPGSSSSSAAPAVFRSIAPPASVPGGPLPSPPPVGAAGPSSAGGGCSPGRGTWICSPSTRGRARFTAASSASSVAPPAARSASSTRAPPGRCTTPGAATAPETWTISSSEAPSSGAAPAAAPSVVSVVSSPSVVSVGSVGSFAEGVPVLGEVPSVISWGLASSSGTAEPEPERCTAPTAMSTSTAIPTSADGE